MYIFQRPKSALKNCGTCSSEGSHRIDRAPRKHGISSGNIDESSHKTKGLNIASCKGSLRITYLLQSQCKHECSNKFATYYPYRIPLVDRNNRGIEISTRVKCYAVCDKGREEISFEIDPNEIVIDWRRAKFN